MSLDDQRTSCPGFLDEYGIWNNGFECPPLANQLRICCGSDSRRYCCTLATLGPSLPTSTDRRRLSSESKTSSSFIDKIQSSRWTLPILFSCLLILILFIISILIWIFLCYCSRRRQRHQQERRKRQDDQSREEQQSTAGKQALLVDHFPFSPPHHQFFFNDTHHPTTRDTLTTTLAPSTVTSTSSNSSVRVPSDIYFHDWKEFFVTNDQQPLNIYPSVSSPQNSFHFQNYCDEDDIIV